MTKDIKGVDEKVDELVAKAKEGDMEAFGLLFDELSPRIFKFLSLRTDKASAEDLLHDTFVEIWKSLPRYEKRPDAKFSTWAFSICRHLLMTHYRKGRVQVDISEVEVVSEEDIETEVSANRVKAAINGLPEKERTALTLSLLDGFSYAEVAKVMGVNENYARQLAFRAKNRLNKQFYGQI